MSIRRPLHPLPPFFYAFRLFHVVVDDVDGVAGGSPVRVDHEREDEKALAPVGGTALQ